MTVCLRLYVSAQHITGEARPVYVARLPEVCATAEEWELSVRAGLSHPTQNDASHSSLEIDEHHIEK